MQDTENNTKNNSAESEVLAKIAKFSDQFRPIGERLHTLIMNAAPLVPRTWYGMPGYAKTKDGPVLVFFREDKYVSFGLTENAALIHSETSKLMNSAWYLTSLDEATEAEIVEIVQRAVAE